MGKFINLHHELLADDCFVNLVNHLVRRLHLPVGVIAAEGTVVAAATRYRWLRHAATQLERAYRALPRRQRRRSPTNPPPEPNRREPEECGSRQRVECISERTALGPMLAQHERALGAVPSALRLDASYLGIGLLTRPSARSRCCVPAAGPLTRTGNGASAVNRWS